MRLAAWLKRNWLILTGCVGIAMTSAGAATVAHQLGSIHTTATGAGLASIVLGATLLGLVKLATKYTIVEV
jgi:hypothetical protein